MFSTLDCKAGYWQVEIVEADRSKKAFVSHHDLFQYRRMPFGLKNEPATFQRLIDIVLSAMKWQFALVYLDDIIIFSSTVQDHLRYLQTVLRLLKDAGLSLKLTKCFFLQSRVDYLGHIVIPRKVTVPSRTCDAVQEMAEPRSVTDLRLFLGLCNVY